MQSLLADRFKLSARFEAKQESVFALVMARPGKLGPQLRKVPEGQPCETDSSAGAGETNNGFSLRCGLVLPMKASASGRVRLGARNASMAYVADWLTSMPSAGIDKPVIDRTNLGEVDFTIEYSPTRSANPDVTPDPNAPTFLEALKDQFGLKLEPTTTPISTLVIDHIEELTPN